QAARNLKNDCERLEIPHHVEELPSEGMDWAQICRMKIRFYRQMQERLGRVLWVDADTRVLRRPDVLAGCTFDLAGFAGRHSYIRDYDPYKTARFWVPAILFIGDTERARNFLALMAEIEAETGERVTDDWVLQEAWLRHTDQLNVGFLSPDNVTRNREDITERTIFLHGDSTNVSTYRSHVAQHVNKSRDPELRARILVSDAMDAMKSGDRETAVLLTGRAVQLLGNDPQVVLKHSEYLRANSRPFESIGLLEEFLARNPDESSVRLSLVKMGIQRHDIELADRHLGLLLTSDAERDRATGESLAYELSLEKRARERGVRTDQRISLWWMKTPYPGNFGDVLSPWIVEQASGIPPRFTARNRSMLAIGSIIKFAGDGCSVWGSGTARMSDALNSSALYRAVRGPLTRQCVLKSGGECPPVYGDPALLLPRYLPKPFKQPSYRLGLVRHISHEQTPLKLDGVKDISLRGAPPQVVERVVNEVADCGAILTTSLHGLIVANAYGIPARWCTLSTSEPGIAGDGTKFADYFQSVGLPVQMPLNLSDYPVITEALRSEVDQTVELKHDGDALLEALHAAI
ncbi:MAG: polysaccharide pyruvyl transferase family protein, partial [Vicinamibacterales bacterium]